MSSLQALIRRFPLPVLLVLCLAALSVSYAFAGEAQRPLSTQIIGDPDAAVNGKFAVGTATPGNKALTVVGVIDFLGAGTVHDYFTQGAGNNMQINTNVDEANAVGDATKSQWKLVLGSSLDWFSIRRSPAGATYNEDALFFIEGSTGNVGIATVDTGNSGVIPFTPLAKVHVETASGDAVRAVTTDTATEITNGVYGRTYATRGNGLYGKALSTTGDAWGVGGDTYAEAGTGVYGYARSTSGYTAGVVGEAVSTQGVGVFGIATSVSGNAPGVYGLSQAANGVGVQGSSYVGVYGDGPFYGVAGSSTSYGTGVYGINTSTLGFAGQFAGNVDVSGNLRVFGTLSKSAGGFRIDHPLDSTKYLNHSFVESSDMMNLYTGIVTLDESGSAWVQLPDWFEALNQDFRYQLTSIGQSAPVYIAQEIQDNRFQIAGGSAGMRVSWLVTGIRHDAYAEAHRIVVEEEKAAQGQGVKAISPGGLPSPRPPVIPTHKP